LRSALSTDFSIAFAIPRRTPKVAEKLEMTGGRSSMKGRDLRRSLARASKQLWILVLAASERMEATGECTALLQLKDHIL
jgi:hypothetical protein